MDFGLSILVGAISASLAFLLKDITTNILSGSWLKVSGEIEEGERIKIKSDFDKIEGVVKKIRLRNVVIETAKGTLLKESEEIFREDVLKLSG